MLYSRSTRGFYSPDIHGSEIPTDAISITPEQHAALLAEQSDGKEIIPGEDGAPVAVECLPSPHDLACVARAWRDLELVRSDNEIRKHGDQDPAAVATEQEWRAYRVRLRNWPQTAEFPQTKPISPT
ncbi:phage tail assembly chaperone [Achromobacter pulmonis]|uniref:phage tail assembly chaperone n=1 Tax=Achromobacter pulmonis TaxID=1389932 RepID=UPI003B8A6BFA